VAGATVAGGRCWKSWGEAAGDVGVFLTVVYSVEWEPSPWEMCEGGPITSGPLSWRDFPLNQVTPGSLGQLGAGVVKEKLALGLLPTKAINL
jgi:hypothetical protein